MSQEIQRQTPHEAISHLPESVLLALARNESAQSEFRLAAVQLMIENEFSAADHPELALLAQEVRRRSAAVAEVTAIVESATEESLDDTTDHGTVDNFKFQTLTGTMPAKPAKSKGWGPFKASVTTETMQQDE